MPHTENVQRHFSCDFTQTEASAKKVLELKNGFCRYSECEGKIQYEGEQIG